MAKLRFVGEQHLTKIAESLRPIIVRNFYDRWELAFRAAQSWAIRYGHCNASEGQTIIGDGGIEIRLGEWIKSQRTAMKTERLSIERISKLESLGIIWDPHTAAWEEGHSVLKQWRDAHGHCAVPSNAAWQSIDGKDFPLGRWINVQRVAKKKGRLSIERQQQLDSLGIVWDPLEEAWMRGLEVARAWYSLHGNLEIPAAASWRLPDGATYSIGRWLNDQRRYRKSGTLSAFRVVALEAMGIVWDVRESAWKKGYLAAVEWRRTYGDCNAPTTARWPEECKDGFPLGQWLVTQRFFRKNGRLSVERISLLDRLDMNWSIRGAATSARTLPSQEGRAMARIESAVNWQPHQRISSKFGLCAVSAQVVDARALLHGYSISAARRSGRRQTHAKKALDFELD
ncbi:helicase associated domain-containing protein [Cupriavidus necator]|uniref:helicase associated domain-containing protein n=1 Tax=Cupriavidus necator TaxID=106590 RepID=UPI003F73A1FF